MSKTVHERNAQDLDVAVIGGGAAGLTIAVNRMSAR